MPRVPTYQTGQVDEVALPNARQSSIASPELFVGMSGAKNITDIGQGLSVIGAAGMRYAANLQEKEDTAAITTLEADLLNRTTQYKLEAQKRQGLNVNGLPIEADDWYQKTVDELAQNTTNDRQKQAFGLIARKHQPGFRSSIGSYTAQQLEKAQESGFKSGLETFQSSAAADPKVAADMRARTISSIDAYAKIKGFDEETRERAKVEELTKLHMGVIGALEASGDVDAAKAYFYSNKKEIDGSSQVKIENALTKSGMEKKVQEAADAIMAMQMPDQEAYAYIEKNYAGEEEKQLKQEFKMRRADLYTAQVRVQAENNDKAWEIYGRTGRLSAIPRDVRDNMDQKMWITLRDKAQNDADAKLGNGDGFPKVGDPKLYSDLRYAAMDDPERFANVDLRQYINKLNKSNYESLLDIQAAAKKKDDVKISEVRTVDGQIGSSLAPFKGLKSSDKVIIEDRLRQQIDAEQKAAGKKFNADERQKIIDRMLIEGEVASGAWYKPDVNVQFYEVVGTPDENKFVPFIPKDERAKIEDALKRNSQPVTDDTVMRLYKKKMGITNK